MAFCSICGALDCSISYNPKSYSRPPWPGCTIYQEDYHSCIPKHVCPKCKAKQGVDCERKVNPDRNMYKLMDPTPPPFVDVHITGATYQPDDPLGVEVPEETIGQRTFMGRPISEPWSVGRRELDQRSYTPNYRYKDWATRPVVQLMHDMEHTNPVVRQPSVNTQHLDFYHERRMGRPSPGLRPCQSPIYVPASVIPIPMQQEVPSAAHAAGVVEDSKVPRSQMADLAAPQPEVLGQHVMVRRVKKGYYESLRQKNRMAELANCL